MTEIIPECDVTIATFADVLNAAAIDCTVEKGGDIYVTTFLFNFWISIDEERKFVRFYSYWPVAVDTPEDRIYQFVNDCNDSLILVQFSVTEDRQRFYGHYMMPYREGLIKSHILRMARLFSELFHQAVEHKDTEDLLGVESLDACASIPDAAERGAVH